MGLIGPLCATFSDKISIPFGTRTELSWVQTLGVASIVKHPAVFFLRVFVMDHKSWLLAASGDLMISVFWTGDMKKIHWSRNNISETHFSLDFWSPTRFVDPGLQVVFFSVVAPGSSSSRWEDSESNLRPLHATQFVIEHDPSLRIIPLISWFETLH